MKIKNIEILKLKEDLKLKEGLKLKDGLKLKLKEKEKDFLIYFNWNLGYLFLIFIFWGQMIYKTYLKVLSYVYL